VFELVKEAFDQVAFFKQPPVGLPLNGPMLSARNDSIRLLVVQQGKNLIRVVALIGQEVLALDIKRIQDLVARHTIVKVAGCYFNSERIAEGVYNRMNLGG
jgi:hypothetical protein